MNVLFLTLLDFDSIEEHNIYTDLLREFRCNGHKLYVISSVERRKRAETHLIKNDGVNILKLKIGNMQKTNILEKGISTVLIETIFVRGIKKYFSNIKFDLVLYSTPPITLENVVKYVKKRDNAITYLMLKDIFPQNAVDLGMLSKTGLRGMLYRYFRNKEKKLYRISDKIGCMSYANIEYVKRHNPEVDTSKIELCPNCIEIQDVSITDEEKRRLRNRYSIPLDKKTFVYGGNLGKPQGIDFLIECLKSQLDNSNVFFLIVGNGTEFGKLQKFFYDYKPINMKLMKSMPKDEYDKMIAACDVGMIFLDHRFTIPNFPSRLLSYMQAGLPVLACTDKNTDVGKVIVEGEFGWWCESNNLSGFTEIIHSLNEQNVQAEKVRVYLKSHYSASEVYEAINKCMC